MRDWWNYEPNPEVVLGALYGLVIGLGLGGWFMQVILS